MIGMIGIAAGAFAIGVATAVLFQPWRKLFQQERRDYLEMRARWWDACALLRQNGLEPPPAERDA